MKKGFKQLIAEANSQVQTCSIESAKQMIGNTETIFVDIREPDELAKNGKIPGAVAAPRGMLEFYADPESPYHKPIFSSGKNILLYCASAGRSALATKALKDMGLENISHMAGGFNGWVAAAGSVEKLEETNVSASPAPSPSEQKDANRPQPVTSTGNA